MKCVETPITGSTRTLEVIKNNSAKYGKESSKNAQKTSIKQICIDINDSI